MPEPRYRQVSIDDTPYYHCISRCVRRAFLCGSDSVTGFNFEHRRQWIVDRIKLLCSVFSVDLCAYAIMSNHYHVVVRINVDEVKQWSDEEVLRRWLQIFTGPLLIHQYRMNASLTNAELKCVAELLTSWRERLSVNRPGFTGDSILTPFIQIRQSRMVELHFSSMPAKESLHRQIFQYFL